MRALFRLSENAQGWLGATFLVVVSLALIVTSILCAKALNDVHYWKVQLATSTCTNAKAQGRLIGTLSHCITAEIANPEDY